MRFDYIHRSKLRQNKKQWDGSSRDREGSRSVDKVTRGNAYVWIGES